MQLGDYYAHHTVRNEWIIVEIVAGLHGAVLYRGCSVAMVEFDEFTGPMRSPPEPGCKPMWMRPSKVAEGFLIDYDSDTNQTR